MKTILDKARVPPGGFFRYKDPETGVGFSHPYFVQVEAMARRHRIANNLPIPTNWEAWLDDQICTATPSCPCEQEGGFAASRGLFHLASRFARAMADWAASGFALVSDEALAARRLACEGNVDHARCSQWQAGAGRFGLGRCAACGCVGGLKSAIASETCPLGKWAV